MNRLKAAFLRLPARLRLPLVLFVLVLALCAAFRVAFWARFSSSAPPAPTAKIAKALYVGFKFDVRLSLILSLPALLLSFAPFLDFVRSPAARRFWLGYGVAAGALIAGVHLADFAHYDWLDGRLSSAVLQHTTEGNIAATIVWESYPVLRGVLAVVVLSAAFGWALQRLGVRTLEPAAPSLSRSRSAVLIGMLVLLCALGLNGKLAGYPLRWGEAASTNPFVQALGLNPLLYFVDTWRPATMTFDEAAARAGYPVVANYLGVARPDPGTLSIRREERPSAPPRSPKPNFVIVFLESFGANKTGLHGSTLDPTPNFDALSKRSLSFPNFFVPSLPTGRSVFASVTGLPDLNPSDSSSNDPKLVRKPTILNAFEGYEKMYFYTGDLGWENIRGLLSANVPDLKLFEQKDYRSPRVDGWGISDLALFEEAHAVFRKSREAPFIAFLQTSGNHRPYTIPADSKGFEAKPADAEALKKNDFLSLEEFQATRFMDHALGLFFRMAEAEAYFRDTVFVVYGDHGSRGAGTNPLQQVRLVSHHVPCFMHGPALLGPPRVVDAPTSSMDVLPTAAGLAGLPYENRGFGRDVFRPRPDGADAVYLWVGLIDREWYYYTAGKRPALYRWRSAAPLEDLRAAEPDRFAAMERQWTALHEMARLLLCRSP